MTDPTYTTVVDAVFALNAYEHNPDDGSWTTDLAPSSHFCRVRGHFKLRMRLMITAADDKSKIATSQ